MQYFLLTPGRISLQDLVYDTATNNEPKYRYQYHIAALEVRRCDETNCLRYHPQHLVATSKLCMTISRYHI